MSDDIVKRARDFADTCRGGPDGEITSEGDLVFELADEIERLRAELELVTAPQEAGGGAMGLVEENRALRERLEELAKHTKALIDARWMFPGGGRLYLDLTKRLIIDVE